MASPADAGWSRPALRLVPLAIAAVAVPIVHRPPAALSRRAQSWSEVGLVERALQRIEVALACVCRARNHRDVRALCLDHRTVEGRHRVVRDHDVTRVPGGVLDLSLIHI